jgi:hypothetical protein
MKVLLIAILFCLLFQTQLQAQEIFDLGLFEPYDQNLLDKRVAFTDLDAKVVILDMPLSIFDIIYPLRASQREINSKEWDFLSQKSLALSFKFNDTSKSDISTVYINFIIDSEKALINRINVNRRELSAKQIVDLFEKTFIPANEKLQNMLNINPINRFLGKSNFETFFTDYPVFFNINTSIYTIIDLVNGYVNQYKKNNINLLVYHRNNIDKIKKNGFYIELIVKNDKTGFAIREANSTVTGEDDKTHFLLLCTIQPNSLSGSTCGEPKIYIDNKLQNNDFILDNDEVFKEVDKNSPGKWAEAG